MVSGEVKRSWQELGRDGTWGKFSTIHTPHSLKSVQKYYFRKGGVQKNKRMSVFIDTQKRIVFHLRSGHSLATINNQPVCALSVLPRSRNGRLCALSLGAHSEYQEESSHGVGNM